MQQPTQVTFQRMQPSEALEAAIDKQVTKLERFFKRITSARVQVSQAHRRHRLGRLFRVKVHLAVSGDELVVDHEHATSLPDTRIPTLPSAEPSTPRDESSRITCGDAGAGDLRGWQNETNLESNVRP